jgi:apolipoprotein N-acyltransferase
MWPEAAPPYFVEGAQTGSFRKVLNQFSTNLGRPILLGAVGESLPRFGQTVSPGLLDGVFLVRPGAGIADEVYAKRHLVPFGEYNPLRTWLPFLGKVVPLDEDTVPGTQAVTIPLNLSSGHTVQIGPLVCYEDVFPNLARDEAKAGADFLAVVTNDAWYGTGGGALQHAAHSVLRAIETRRPVVRCGNDGWSGFIDQDGDAFELEKVGHQIKTDWVLTAQGTTYFRGSGPLYVYTNHQFDGKQTFYVRYGDWFVGLSALLALAGVLAIRKWQRLD